jgi:soluble lytic murein transglycosylase-like protein
VIEAEKPTKYAIDVIQVKIIEGDESEAVSVAGAVGNMQIMPVTLDDWNEQNPSRQYTMDDMTDESKNVRVGKWMLEKRIPEILKSKKVPLTINHILIAYNWGCGNLIKWYKSGAVVARLPAETQQYICKYWAKAKK